MLQNAYLVAKIGADTTENEQHVAEILPIGPLSSCRRFLSRSGRLAGRSVSVTSAPRAAAARPATSGRETHGKIESLGDTKLSDTKVSRPQPLKVHILRPVRKCVIPGLSDVD